MKKADSLDKITIYIDGKTITIPATKTILQAALESGIYIPHLCYHPNLNPAGECRLCMVEIDGANELQASCTTMAREGMVVKTKSPQIDKVRRMAMELMLATHPADCTICPKYLNCELQTLKQYLGVTDELRVRRRPKPIPVVDSNPLFIHDFTRCVLCGRCVRACQELRGVQVLSFLGQNERTRIGIDPAKSLADAGCRFCGACVEVCPTGALRDKEGMVQPGKNRKISLIPCKYACPAEIDVPRYVRFIREKRFGDAIAVIREKVTFPETLGYICNHPCETACRRKYLNQSISIRELKRFAAEKDDTKWRNNCTQRAPTYIKIAVVGSGPCGLTAAYYLAKQGHDVTVFESLPEPGGMMRVGIPEYRLPKCVLNKEIKEIERVGIEIRLNTKIDVLNDLIKEGYKAVLVAIGAHQGVKLRIPGADNFENVLNGVDFLRDVNLGKPHKVGKKVVVLGGGNVAFDCARTAKRLGCEEIHVACLESREKMLASTEEIEQGITEGVAIHPSLTFTRILNNNGHLMGVECLTVQSFEINKEKGLEVNTIKNSEQLLPADTVIFAVGQRPDIPDKFGLNIDGINPELLLKGREGIFAAGDVVTGTASVIDAIVAGRKAAIGIDRYLGGNGEIEEVLAPIEELSDWLGQDENFAWLEQCEVPLVPPEARKKNFSKVLIGYNEHDALEESKRCLQCDLRFKISSVRYWADYQCLEEKI